MIYKLMIIAQKAWKNSKDLVNLKNHKDHENQDDCEN